MKEAGDTPVEPPRIGAVSGKRARGRGELVLLRQLAELEPPPRHPDAGDAGQLEGDRIVAESRRYRIAVVRQARRRRLARNAAGAP